MQNESNTSRVSDSKSTNNTRLSTGSETTSMNSPSNKSLVFDDNNANKSNKSSSCCSDNHTSPEKSMDSLLFKQVSSCHGCQKPILGQVITALGHLWHPDHFVCSHCNGCIGTSIFYEKDSRPYCEHDYLKLFSPKCAACELPILDVTHI